MKLKISRPALFLATALLCLQSWAEPKVIEIGEQPHETLISADVWKIIFGAELAKASQRAGALIFVPIEVELTEKNPGVLTYPEILLKFPKGGGDLDLAHYLTGKQGTFFVKFHFDMPKEPEAFNVLYVSQARKRKVDGAILGSGCNSILELKDFYFQENSKEGIKVNTTQARHISVLAGNFILSYMANKTTYVSKVSFLDSRSKNLMCEGFRAE
jgi:hypothetical protein